MKYEYIRSGLDAHVCEMHVGIVWDHHDLYCQTISRLSVHLKRPLGRLGNFDIMLSDELILGDRQNGINT